MGKKDKLKHQSSEVNVAKKPLKTKETGIKASTSGKGKKGSEIDDIFKQIKPKDTEGDMGKASTSQHGKEGTAKTKKSKALSGSKDDIFGKEEDKSRKRTEEGYRIYTEEELGLNKKGGDTDLCPFDCDCCF